MPLNEILSSSTNWICFIEVHKERNKLRRKQRISRIQNHLYAEVNENSELSE